MNDKILDRYTGRNTASAESQAVPAADGGEDAENFGCFGWLRGVRDRAICIELRKKDGHVLAIPYAYISRMELDPAGQIVLVSGAESIVIKGRNLNGEFRPGIRLFQGITRHRVSYVQEADRPAALNADGQAVVVDLIDWQSGG